MATKSAASVLCGFFQRNDVNCASQREQPWKIPAGFRNLSQCTTVVVRWIVALALPC
jgi:hypothetical protein